MTNDNRSGDRDDECDDHRSPDLSVLVVCYQSRADIERCLDSLQSTAGALRLEVILIDNSSDGCDELVRDRYPDVRVLPSQGNLGFAAANNVCAEQATADTLLLLNPDTETLPGAIIRLVEALDSAPEAGIMGGLTVLPTGAPEPSSHQSEPTIGNELLRLVGLARLARGGLAADATQPADVAVVSGAFAAVRRSAWDRVGGFDTSFWMYSEEVDLCDRVRAHGWRVMMTPAAQVVHYVGSSSSAPERQLAILRGKMHRSLRVAGPARHRALGAVLWLQSLSRAAVGCLAAPIATSRARRLRSAHGAAARHPSRWWHGYQDRSTAPTSAATPGSAR